MAKNRKQSAGILLYRKISGLIEVLLAHPGGPIWKNRDSGAWTIPKGEIGENEDPFVASKREFAEETGVQLNYNEVIPLGTTILKSGKTIYAWACEGDLDASTIKSNTFLLEYPKKSGNFQEFPEIDRCGWFTVDDARTKIHPAQFVFVERLKAHLG